MFGWMHASKDIIRILHFYCLDPAVVVVVGVLSRDVLLHQNAIYQYSSGKGKRRHDTTQPGGRTRVVVLSVVSTTIKSNKNRKNIKCEMKK